MLARCFVRAGRGPEGGRARGFPQEPCATGGFGLYASEQVRCPGCQVRSVPEARASVRSAELHGLIRPGQAHRAPPASLFTQGVARSTRAPVCRPCLAATFREALESIGISCPIFPTLALPSPFFVRSKPRATAIPPRSSASRFPRCSKGAISSASRRPAPARPLPSRCPRSTAWRPIRSPASRPRAACWCSRPPVNSPRRSPRT